MARVLIVGYGNPLRGDDGLGWHAAAALEGAVPGAEVLTVHQLTPELAEDVSRAELAVFIDAREGGTPGEWRSEPVEPASEAAGAFTHHVTPGSLLAAARLLYGRQPAGVLFSMSGACFDLGEGLSAPVTAALPAIVEAIASAAWKASGVTPP